MHKWVFSRSLSVFKIQTFSIDPSMEVFVSTLQRHGSYAFVYVQNHEALNNETRDLHIYRRSLVCYLAGTDIMSGQHNI